MAWILLTGACLTGAFSGAICAWKRLKGDKVRAGRAFAFLALVLLTGFFLGLAQYGPAVDKEEAAVKRLAHTLMARTVAAEQAIYAHYGRYSSSATDLATVAPSLAPSVVAGTPTSFQGAFPESYSEGEGQVIYVQVGSITKSVSIVVEAGMDVEVASPVTLKQSLLEGSTSKS